MSKIVVGSDPEFFIVRKADNGDLYVVPPAKYRFDMGVPADLSEDERHPIFAIQDGQNGRIKLIEDGCALELTVPPSHSIDTLYQDIQLGYQMGSDLAKQFGHETMTIPTINFDVHEFENRSDDFKFCLQFGCDKDWEVFEMEGLIPKSPELERATEHPFRYAGGHMHVSGCKFFADPKYGKPLLAVKQMAIFVGNLVTFLSPLRELDQKRTFRYGKPGRFRPQNYGKLFNGEEFTDTGIEYRTPSTAWTTSLDLARRMAECMQIIADRILPDDDLMEGMINEFQQPTIEAIMHGDAELSKSIFDAAMSLI